MTKEILINGHGFGFSNRFKAQVIERRPGHPDEGKVVFETPLAPNLILSAGMDRVATTKICDLFTHCAIGSGTTPTEDSSGAITATTAGVTCTADTSFFTGSDEGKLLVFATGEKSIIFDYVSGTGVTLTDTLNVASGTAFTMYRIAQTGLATEVKRTNTYLTGTGNCGTVLAGSVFTHQRTFDFTTEVGDVTYSEVGFSNSASVAANLNMRGIFSGAPVAVATGQALRVVYYFVVTLSPTSPRTAAVPISGWPSLEHPVAPDNTTNKITLASHGFVAGTEVFFDGAVVPTGLVFGTKYYVITDTASTFKLAANYADAIAGTPEVDFTSDGTTVILFTNTAGTEQIANPLISSVSTAGNTTRYQIGPNSQSLDILEPTSTVARGMGISTSSAAHPSFPQTNQQGYTAITNGTATLAAVAYTAANNYRDWDCTYAVGSGNSAAIRSFYITTVDSGGGLRYLFSYPQEKTNLYTLKIVWRYRWDWDFI